MATNTPVPSLQPKLKYDVGSIVAPGDTISRGSTVPSMGSNPIRVRLVPGPGTYVRGNALVASTVGTLQIRPAEKDQDVATTEGQAASLPTVMVSVLPGSSSTATFASQSVLRQHQIVLAKVLRLALQHVVVEIVANEHGLLRPYQYAEGWLRREDIKTAAQQSETTATSTTTSTLAHSFQPGDYLVARIVSLGDARKYYVSTAEPALGVIFARSSSSVSKRPMMPVSWKEMECPETGVKEPRKCAKPQPLPAELQEALQAAAVLN